jgi:uncharacterized protein (TIGR03437 family)
MRARLALCTPAILRVCCYALLMGAPVAGQTITTGFYLPFAYENNPYSLTFTASGGSPPYKNWQLSLKGNPTMYTLFPAGLTLNADTGVLSGTPKPGTWGQYFVNVTVMDSNNRRSAPVSFLLVEYSTAYLDAISPNFAVAGGPGFTLSVNVVPDATGCTVRWNETSLTTTTTAGSLTAQVPASLIVTPDTVNITVLCTSEGFISDPLPFTISTVPLPVIDSIDPSSAVAPSPPLTVAIHGTGFTSADVVLFGGIPVPAAFVNPSQLNAFLQRQDNPGRAGFVVQDPSGFVSNPVFFTLVSASSGPVITSGGVVPVYSSSSTIQPGEWVSIYGTSLAGATAIWTGNFPISLGGTSVTINNKPAYLWLVSSGQINLQVPDDSATGTVPVVVATAAGKTTSTVTMAQFAPSFSLLDAKHVTGIILRPDGSGAYGGGAYDTIGPTGTSLGYSTVAAKAGDTIELFGVGFGPTSPAVPAGQVFSGAAATTNPVNLLIDKVSVTPSFAGLSAAGLYQINLTVPAGLGTGDVSLQASGGGMQTPSGVVISLQ